MTQRSSWRLAGLGGAMALLGSLCINPAHALGLGRITVQSALGEALRAEIEVPEISADEASSLRVGVATAATFKAAGLDYSPAVAGIQIILQKRADGRSFLSLSSSRPVTEPFVDLMLEASWSSGRVVRDYIMLFDPPNLRQAPVSAAVAPTAPIMSPPSAPSNPTSARTAQPALRATAPKVGKQVTVKAGDTAGKIAEQNKLASISLDQMLVALLKSNPDAFINDNVNRLKSGAVLDIPAAEDAAAMSRSEASRTIVAQSKDFNSFRQKLAGAVPGAQVESASRQSAGKVQAKVDDRAPAAAVSDKLTLSKGVLQGNAAAEDKIARDMQAKEASNRVAELAKNIGDLNKIAGVTPAAPGAAASTPVASTTVAAATAAASSPAASSASAATTTAASVAPPDASSAPIASTPVAVEKPVVATQPPPEPSLIDELTGNSLVLPGLGALLALLAGLGFYRFKKRNDQAAVDSSFLESRLQPDSFFGASGGQRIDTSEAGNTAGPLMVYSTSPLDTAGDVDPVAEADVYLAYGRELQAEEILKEALRTNPSSVAVHAKLIEIYAKRRDLKAFEITAAQAFSITNGTGPQWAYICELGHDLDPSNPIYQPASQPQKSEGVAAAMMPAAVLSFSADTMPQMMAASPGFADPAVDFDLDLEVSADDGPASAEPPVRPPVPVDAPEPTVVTGVADDTMFAGLEMDFSVDQPVTIAPPPSRDSLSFSADPLPAAAGVHVPSDNGMLEFDMGSLSLDLDAPAIEPGAAPAPVSLPVEGPLQTKFALAEEFRALGDAEGARSLASEVVAQAQGDLKTKAQAFLNTLS
ncbi:MAG: FimV/HubP family polar landmark protein [Polaromonas sp.]|jgi:pilus assembly protein FimV